MKSTQTGYACNTAPAPVLSPQLPGSPPSIQQGQHLEPEQLRTMADALLQWAAQAGRRPPWRSTQDGYALAVAEILLQKTKGADAEPVWQEVLARYPTPQTLANAGIEEVRQVIARLGLGTQRAARLKAMAKALSTSGTAGKVPGLGPYGSAVLALAQGREPVTPPVDGNIARVICRLFGFRFERGEPRKKPEVKQAVAALLATQQTPGRKLALVYALVDLGAAACTPNKPACAGCPVSPWCAFVHSPATPSVPHAGYPSASAIA
jgi:A/G-specific adenine glycosylase